MAGECHLGQRGEQTAVGAVVIGQHQPLRFHVGLAHRRTAAARCGSFRSAGSSPSWPYACASAEPPSRLRPAPRSISHSDVSPASVLQLRRQRTAHVTAPVRTPKRSARQARRPSSQRPSSFHTVFIDNESLPTGMAMPSAGHSSSPTVAHMSHTAPRPRPVRRRRPSSSPTN